VDDLVAAADAREPCSDGGDVESLHAPDASRAFPSGPSRTISV
jgi:hypothetical protein